jgi:sugar lactone lactonase YvrE
MGSDQRGRLIQEVCKGGVSDGLLHTPDGVYLTALEFNAIRRVDLLGRVRIIARDDRIRWPDSLALGPDGRIWFTTAQIHLGDEPSEPYRIFRFDPEAR